MTASRGEFSCNVIAAFGSQTFTIASGVYLLKSSTGTARFDS
jgi:hypothetical protein